MKSLQEIRDEMSKKFGDLIPEFELEEKAKLVEEILRLKKERGVLILGHNYMEPALFHMVADEKGDSLELCRKAQSAKEDTILFLGVEFMAETAKIINPSKKVLVPSQKAGCSLASSITAADVRKIKEKYKGVPVVTYINTYADVKAECDLVCTSGNASKVVEALDSDTIIFLPDRYLAGNIARDTGKKIIFPFSNPDDALLSGDALKNTFIGWNGRCEVHEKFTVEDISRVREQFPDVKVLAHPECPTDVVEASDFSGSTSAMIKFVKDNKNARYLLLTECAMADNIIAENPGSELLRLCSHRCPYMAEITLQDTVAALKEMKYEITLDPEVMEKARHSIERMLEIF